MLSVTKVAVFRQKLGDTAGATATAVSLFNTLTYLAVSSACYIHVKDELAVILGAVGPRWAAGGHR